MYRRGEQLHIMVRPTIPTWSELFGSLDTKDADAGRSMNAPAAYLADLLQLLEDRFDPTDFRARRPDIETKIKLNGDQSFTLTRQLDIANGLLGNRIQQQAGTAPGMVLAAAQHPFSLPFEFQHERVRQLLLLLRTPHRELQASFTPRADIDVLVRDRLGLSPARLDTVVQDNSQAAANLAAAYGLTNKETLADLTDLERFRRATQLDAPSLRLLLFSQLSQAQDAHGISERDAKAGDLFINHDLGGFVKLDDEEQKLIWTGGSVGIPDAWFDRVHRLLCLSRWTRIDLSSLDLVLRQLGRNTIDINALRYLAVVFDLRDRTNSSIDVLCSLFAELDGSATLGAGDDPLQPASLFDRVFNGDRARLTQRYVPSGADQLPQTYAAWSPLVATGDLLADLADNKQLRTRIQASLEISAADLSAVITSFRDRAAAAIPVRTSPVASIDARSLSLLHRVTQLAELTDLAPLELLRLVRVLEKDPNIKVLNVFDVLCHEDTAQADLYQVLEQGPLEARFWLIQNVLAVAAWASAAGLEPADLESVVVVPGETDPARRASLLAIAQALHDAFLPCALNSGALQSETIGERTARVALATFERPTWHLVPGAGLVKWDKHQASAAAHAAIAALDVVSAEDIESLQLGEDLAAYLQSLLVRRGLLDASGVFREDQLPLKAEDLILEPDGTTQFAQIFDLLSSLYTAAYSQATTARAAAAMADDTAATDTVTDTTADNTSAADVGADDTSADDTGTDDAGADDVDAESEQADLTADIELHLFPSDLLKLGFTASEAGEWIERLTFLHMLDGSGMVQDPALFSDSANRETIAISVGLNAFNKEIYADLAARRDRWLNATLTLPTDIWGTLNLTSAERDCLEQNLIFNGHIDAARRIVDRRVLQSLTPDTFDVALQYYRHRRPILNALQSVVAASRTNSLVVRPDDLRPLANRFIGVDVHDLLAATYLDAQGRLNPAVLAEIDVTESPLDLGSAYSAPQSQLIWTLLQQINTEASKFRLTDAALATVQITDQDAANVVVSLCADGYLQPDRSLSPEQVKHFAVVNNALDFVIPQYVDYSRDVFFKLHDVAVAAAASVKALTTSLKAAADAQEKAVLETIGSQFGIAPEATSAILRPMLREEPSVACATMTPVLAAFVDDVLSDPPSDRMFCETMGRAQAFANFAIKLRMSPRQIQAAFQDQQLVDKFPEGIQLPPGVDGIDALWAGPSRQPAGSWTLSSGDLVNLSSLADKLEQPSRLIDTWLVSQLSAATLSGLDEYMSSGADTALEADLLRDINRLLLGPSIYDTQRFNGIALRPKVQKLLTTALQGSDFASLNRLLLEDAYPAGIGQKSVLFVSRRPVLDVRRKHSGTERRAHRS